MASVLTTRIMFIDEQKQLNDVRRTEEIHSARFYLIKHILLINVIGNLVAITRIGTTIFLSQI